MRHLTFLPLATALLIALTTKNSQDSSFAIEGISNLLDDSRELLDHASLENVLTPSTPHILSCKALKGDTWGSFLRKTSFSREDIQKVLPLLSSYSLKEGTIIYYGPQGLEIPFSSHKMILIQKDSKGFYYAKEKIQTLKKESRYVYGGIQSSFYQTLAQKGVPASITHKVVKHLSYIVNFQHSIQANDPFELVYDVYTDKNGKTIQDGKIYYIALFTKGQIYQLYRFGDDFFNAKGESLKRGLLATPLDVRNLRVTSHFQKGRFHPIKGYCRDHKGVDFGARHGTPVMAAGDGVVVHASYHRGGYGNMVKIKHTSGFETVYAHLSKISVRCGARVKQKSCIGNVGATGLASGPHLHYEILLNRVHQNPLHVKQAPITRLTRGEYREFQKIKRGIETQIVGIPTLLASKKRIVS